MDGRSPTDEAVASPVELPAGGLPAASVFGAAMIVEGAVSYEQWWAEHADDAESDDDAGVPVSGSPGELGAVWALMVSARRRSIDLAEYLTAVHAVAHPEHVGATPDAFAADTVGSTLGWSASMASGWVEFADDAIDRLPRVHAAMTEGWLDEVKARTICEWTRSMPDDLARIVTGLVLPGAPALSKADLIDEIGSRAAVLDPDWAERRQQEARARVRVVATRNPSGTADVALRDLSPADSVTLMARLDALSWPVRAAGRAMGLPVSIHAVRALVSLRLQDGTYVGLDDDELQAALAEELPAWWASVSGDATTREAAPDDSEPDDHGQPDEPDGGPDGPDDGPRPDGPDDGGPDDGGPDDGGPDDGQLPDDLGGPGGSGGAEPGDDRAGSDSEGANRSDPGDAAGADEPAADEPGADEPGAAEALGDGDGIGEDGHGDHGHGDHGRPPESLDEFARTHGGVRMGTVEVRLRLSTALGLDELPGSVPTCGRVTASTARDLLDRARAGDVPVEWRLVLVDVHGSPENVLLVRPDTPARPPGPRHRRGQTRGRMIVELTAPATLLAALDPDHHGAWTGYLRRARARWTALTDDERRGGRSHPASSLADALARRPGRELERWVRVRDRHCVGPMCSRAAHSDDIDHTRDWADRGRSVAANLGPLCRHCHRLKHEGCWTLEQPTPGRFVWTTRAGARHEAVPRRDISGEGSPVPRADGRPRPVLDGGPPMPPRSGWVDLRPRRASVGAEVPARPAWPVATDDEPPPF